MRTVLSAISAFVVVALPAVPFPTYADSGPLYDGVSGFAMDAEHDRMFVSATENGVAKLLVMDLRGQVTASVDVAGAGQPVLTADRSSVLMAMPGHDAVAVVDTATLASRTVSTEPGSCPSQITETGGGFWVLVGCSDYWSNLALIDLETGDLTRFDVEGWPEYRPTIGASPELPGTLVMTSGEPARVDLVSASAAGTPSVSIRASRDLARWGERPTAAVSPDGSRIAVASETRFIDLSSSDLEVLSESSVGPGRLAAGVAFRPDGWRADVHYDYTGSHDYYIVVMRRPDGSVFRRFRLPTRYGVADMSRSFRWGPRHLYAVVGSRLRVFEQKLPSRLVVRVDREQYAQGAVARIEVRLASPSQNRRVRLYATPYGRDRELVASGEVDEDGYLDARLTVARNTVLEARFGGDADHEGATVAHPVRVVSRVRSWLEGYQRRSGRYAVYRKDVSAKVVAQPLRGHPRDFVCFDAYRDDGSGWKYWYTDCGHLDATGRCSARLRRALVGDRIRVRAEWEGNSAFATSVGPWQYYRVVR